MSLIFSDASEEDIHLRIVASEEGLEIVASGPNGRREGTIFEPKELIGILSDILNPSEDEVLA